MESGLEGRNNLPIPLRKLAAILSVSMESGLEGRNNIEREVIREW